MRKDKNLIKSSFKIITNRYIYGLEFFDKIQRQLPGLVPVSTGINSVEKNEIPFGNLG